MNIVAAIRRFFGFHGEGLLAAATADLDKVATKLDAAAAQIDVEFESEVQSIMVARQKHSAREFQSRQTIDALTESRDRTKRVAGRIKGLVA
jgi:hypothetical protein